MKRSILIISILLSLIFMSINQNIYAFDYEPATKLSITVKMSVTHNQTSNTFTYIYEVINHPDSIQDLDLIRIEYEGEPPTVSEPEDWRGEASRTSVIYEGEENILDPRTSNNRPYVHWFPWDDSIIPGNSQGNLKIESMGIPEIMMYYAQGYVKPPSVPYGYADHTEMPEEISDFYKNSVKGKTLGPIDPPETFESLSFIDSIIAYKEESVELGWISDHGVSDSLNQKLANARKMIESDKPSAKNILQALLNELDAQKGQHVKDEAYYLLKYNVLYLMDKL